MIAIALGPGNIKVKRLDQFNSRSQLSQPNRLFTLFPLFLLLASGYKLDWSHQYTRHSWTEVSKLKSAVRADHRMSFLVFVTESKIKMIK